MNAPFILDIRNIYPGSQFGVWFKDAANCGFLPFYYSKNAAGGELQFDLTPYIGFYYLVTRRFHSTPIVTIRGISKGRLFHLDLDIRSDVLNVVTVSH